MRTLKLTSTLITALFLFTAIGSSKLVDDKQNVLHETVTSL